MAQAEGRPKTAFASCPTERPAPGTTTLPERRPGWLLAVQAKRRDALVGMAAAAEFDEVDGASQGIEVP